uniref:Patatin group A-3 n=1 Tax=Lygus hesperus TaxID=30085 RepID=A0A0A9X9S5_LYGHE
MEKAVGQRKGLISLLPATRNSTPVFLLAIDGGGIRSLLSLYALKFIEDELGIPISSVFDIISATSTATLVATGLVVPNNEKSQEPMYSADDLIQVITSSMPEIFPTTLPVDPYITRPRYDTDSLMDFLEVFYPGKFESALTALVFPVYDRLSEDQYLFTSWAEIKPELRFQDVLRATVATPNYFPAADMVVDDEELKLVDGSLHDYNPTNVVMEEARKNLPFRPTVVLSLGSGTVQKMKPPFIARTPVSPTWGSPFQDRKIRCQAELIDVYMRRNSFNYSRAQIALSTMEDSLLNDFHEETEFQPSTLTVLEDVGNRYVDENRKALLRFCDYFRRRREIKDPLSKRNGWELPDTTKVLVSRLHDLMSPLDYIEPDDAEGLANAKSDLLKCLQAETAEETHMKYRYYVFKGHPLYKGMKKWMQFFEENSKPYYRYK